jgi:hypothetical protein
MVRALSRTAGTASALALVLGGCGAGWHRVEPRPAPVAPRQQAQVWHDDRFEQWHALLVSSDSVSGVPYFRAVGCDSCRVALPRDAVDSLRYGNPTAGFWKTVGLVFGSTALFVAVACGSDGTGCTD